MSEEGNHQGASIDEALTPAEASRDSIMFPWNVTRTLVQFKPLVDIEKLQFGEKIGHGSYGVVYRVNYEERLVAAKEFGASADQEAIETEVRQLSRVSHPNIIQLYGISANQHSIYLIMEYIEGGSLHAFLHGPVKPYYSTAHAMSWARQCAEGVAYLHAMKPKPLIHRDLKPLNLLLSNKGRHLKICDFGTVADQATRMTNNKGTAVFMAPEVFSTCNYNEKCDVFSWATVLWVVLTRQQPFKEVETAYSIQWRIYSGQRPPMNPSFPKPIQCLMSACWDPVPNSRPTMQRVLAVMNELTASLVGADEPLEYEFRNQQIICNDSTRSSEDSYMLDFSSLSPSDQSNASLDLTPTNTTDHTNNSDTSITPTPTNSTEMEPAFDMAPHIPTAKIAASTRWDVIQEESESSVYQQSQELASISDPFNLTPSSSTSQRYETICNGMNQKASVPIGLLSVDVDPNAWELAYNAGAGNLAKSDGKERLTVTDTKPIMQNNTLADKAIDGALVEAETDDVEEIDGTDQSLTEMLDPELQPEPPIADNEESQAIYREHRRLAKEYLRVDTKLYYAQDFKDKILIQMDPEERQKKQELLKKMSEKQELLELLNNLKQQMESLNTDQPDHNLGQLAQQTGAVTGPQQGDMVADDGWVVIPASQNT